jgi:nucleotide-binding universal stress UspA family protein
MRELPAMRSPALGYVVARRSAMTFRKILCPIDVSGSTEAVRVAARIAIRHASELVIAHSWYLPPVVFAGEFSYPADLVQGLTADAERGLTAAVDEARTLGASRVTTLLLSGPPWERIVEAAEAAKEVDLIVVGTRGHTGLARLFLGSVAEMVVRHAPCSVLALPSGGDKPFLRILCPIDFSPSSNYALELANELGNSAQSLLTLLHVLEPVGAVNRTFAFEPGPDLVRGSQTVLEQWTAATGRTERQVTTSVRVGRTREELRSLLEDQARFDLVALGSHGRTGLRRMFLGSVAETVVRHAKCAVLVARRRA